MSTNTQIQGSGCSKYTYQGEVPGAPSVWSESSPSAGTEEQRHWKDSGVSSDEEKKEEKQQEGEGLNIYYQAAATKLLLLLQGV